MPVIIEAQSGNLLPAESPQPAFTEEAWAAPSTHFWRLGGLGVRTAAAVRQHFARHNRPIAQ
jgi:hypothetical protein